MEEKKDKRKKCPVCGRFCSAEAVDKYNGLLNERNRLAKELDKVAEELGAIRKSVAEGKEAAYKLKSDCESYEMLYLEYRGKLDKSEARLADAGAKMVAMQSELNDLRAQNERLMDRGFFARLFNKQV